MGFYEEVPNQDCWENTGKSPVGVTWVDTKKGGKENPEHGCRLLTKEIKKDKRDDLFAAMPPLEAKKMLFAMWAIILGMILDFIDFVLTPTQEPGDEFTWSCFRRTTRRACAVCSRRHCTARETQLKIGSWRVHGDDDGGGFQARGV